MNELKTFNEIDKKYYEELEDYQDKIRDEAIKWIQEHKKHFLDTEMVISYPGNFNYSFGMRCGAILMLKQFFNITEDDLK